MGLSQMIQSDFLIDVLLAEVGRHARWLAFFTYLCLAGCNGNSSFKPTDTRKSENPIARMRGAMERREWQLADVLAQKALIANPNDADLITDAARIAALCDRKREAAQLLVDAAAISKYQPASRVDFAVQALIDVGELYRAIELLENSLKVSPENHNHRRVLVGFLGEAQRTELIAPHYQKLIRARHFDVYLLVAATDTTSRQFSENTDDRLMKRNPSDYRVRLARANELFYLHDAVAADAVLSEILMHHPDFAPAYALHGQVLMDQRRLEEVGRWIANASVDCGKLTDYWLTLGDWAVEYGQQPQAVKAYWEATRRDPNNSTAWTRLAQSIRRLHGDQEDNPRVASDEQLKDIDQRIADLLELRKQYYRFNHGGQKSQLDATRVAEKLMSLGRNWEAEAWTAIGTTLKQDPSEKLTSLRRTILGKLKADTSWLSKHGHPALVMDLAYLPNPTIASTPARPVNFDVVPAIVSSDHILLGEVAEQWGLSCVGQENNPSDARLAALIRSTGIGGGAIDYDLDGLPDCLIMGAGGTMLKQDSQPNELMRNQGEHFVSVTRLAGAVDTGYGQGVAVGDFDEDGFPDLFFANLGTNRLLRNNGDGTFTDVSERLDDGGWKEWTTCGVFADINEDGIADLFTTNYCETVSNLDEACANKQGVLGPCHPLKFPAKKDQFLVGTAQGTLKDVSTNWIPKGSPGRGLGILAGAIDGSKFGVYIANDMSANSFYTRGESVEASLHESAAARGIAVDGRTLAQASMGIASSDFDRDGDLDLYVTGFGMEFNIYYEQVAPGLWQDETSRLGLALPTLRVVGFGAQAIDLDSDGIDEIIVTNGHIGQFSNPDSLPYEQPLQLFRRNSTGSFELLNDDAWGPYFATPHVGRALWTIDVNRDGRNDVMITHSNEQVRLLVNRTKDVNDRIAFKLVGTRNTRDAIGAIVRFECNGQQRSLWLLGGDGYMCSNERVLRAGLGDSDEVQNVTVTWQDGTVQRLGNLNSNTEYLIVQDDHTAFVLDHF